MDGRCIEWDGGKQEWISGLINMLSPGYLIGYFLTISYLWFGNLQFPSYGLGDLKGPALQDKVKYALEVISDREPAFHSLADFFWPKTHPEGGNQ